MLFGAYVKYQDGEEEQVKEQLRGELHKFVDKLCERDDFWITKTKTTESPYNTIGYKIDVPYMKEQE